MYVGTVFVLNVHIGGDNKGYGMVFGKCDSIDFLLFYRCRYMYWHGVSGGGGGSHERVSAV